MFNKLAIQSLVASAVFALTLPMIQTVEAGDTKPPDRKVICHNIGGPSELGANCDGLTNAEISGDRECLESIDPVLVFRYGEAVASCGVSADCVDNIYAGICVPHSPQADLAHIAHGDGFAVSCFERIHDNTILHDSRNVDCFAVRVNSQPTEPGN